MRRNLNCGPLVVFGSFLCPERKAVGKHCREMAPFQLWLPRMLIANLLDPVESGNYSTDIPPPSYQSILVAILLAVCVVVRALYLLSLS